MDSSTFFGGDEPAPDPQGYDRYGRYLLDADGTGQKSYTRATTLAKTLDDGHGLAIYGQRKAAKGVAMSPALTARAAVTPLDDRKVWREIIDQAEVKSGGDEKRDWGSAFHEFHERVPGMTDDEYAAQAVELWVTYERYRAELDRLGITEVLTEGTCVNQQIGTAGKFDAIFRLADGRLVIGDRKTGRLVEYPHSPAQQLAIYANADTMIEFDENGAQHRLPMPDVDKHIALAVDITIGDEDTAAVHVYEVDIWAGWYGALLAGQVRRWRNRKDLIRPYHPEFPPAEKALAAAAIEQGLRDFVPPVKVSAQVLPVSPEMAAELTPGTYAAAGTEVDPDSEKWAAAQTSLPENQAWFEQQTPGQAPPVEPADRLDANTANTKQLGGPMTQPAHAAHPITKQAWSSAEQRNITLNPDGTRADGLTGPQVSAIAQPPEPTLNDDEDALLVQYKTKAQLQTAAKSLGLTNLSRTRANLAKDMAAHPNWAAQRAALLGKTDVAMGIIAEGDQHEQDGTGPVAESFSSVVSNAPGPVPPDPEPTARPVQPEDIVDAMAPLPTDGNPFRPAAAPKPTPTKTVEDELVERIANATSTNELSDIWEAANQAGLGWPPRLHQASTIRAKQLEQEGQ
jgi:hypothetical protein